MLINKIVTRAEILEGGEKERHLELGGPPPPLTTGLSVYRRVLASWALSPRVGAAGRFPEASCVMCCASALSTASLISSLVLSSRLPHTVDRPGFLTKMEPAAPRESRHETKGNFPASNARPSGVRPRESLVPNASSHSAAESESCSASSPATSSAITSSCRRPRVPACCLAGVPVSLVCCLMFRRSQQKRGQDGRKAYRRKRHPCSQDS